MRPAMTSQFTTQGSPQVIEQDIGCVRCEYNLRTLAKTGLCPECGLEVARTLAAMEVADARWLRRMTWGLRWFFLAVLGLQSIDMWWDPWRAARLLFWGATLIGVAWLVTTRIPNRVGRSSIPHARWIARGAIAGMAPMFLWCCWRQYDSEGTQALVSLLFIIGLAASFAHLANVARHLQLRSLARSFLCVPVLHVLGLMPRAIGYWGFTRFDRRPPFNEMACDYAGIILYWVGWVFGLVLIGRVLCKLDQIQGTSIGHLSIDRKSGARLRWGIILLGTMPLLYSLHSHPIVWLWQVAFPIASIVYVTGLCLVSSDPTGPKGMRIALRTSAIFLLLTSIVPFVASWNLSLYRHSAVLVVSQVLFISWVLCVCLSFVLLRGVAARLGYGSLAKSLAVRSVLLPMFFLSLDGLNWLLFFGPATRNPLQAVWQVVHWVVLLGALESSPGIGRLIQAMVENTRVVDGLTAYEGSRGGEIRSTGFVDGTD
ncbi:MAG: hypothetical protein ACM359_13375 [Bacillota bacterium]